MTRDHSLRGSLTGRQETILRVVIEDHVSSGQPVGSKHIAGREGLDVGASTVRYELARLEDLGFLNHPHTSAGRVPTDRGYRYYVDEILPREPGLPVTRDAISRSLELGEMRREIDAALRRLAEVVAQVTSLLSVVTAPQPASATVRHVEVLVLQPQLVMVVVITSTGAVTKRVFAFEEPVDPRLAEWAASFLNERVRGLAVGARMIESRLEEPSLTPRERAFVASLAPALTDLDPEERQHVYVAGQGRFLAEYREQDLREIDALMTAIEQRAALLELLRGALARNELYLRIGGEIGEPLFQGLSVVAANYGVARRNLGTISLIGPRRMDYRLAIATVREAAHALSNYVEGVYE
ncbi:MAG: heat-inducible transcriptional repressor HrcA [Actinomycetota bacterium]